MSEAIELNLFLLLLTIVLLVICLIVFKDEIKIFFYHKIFIILPIVFLAITFLSIYVSNIVVSNNKLSLILLLTGLCIPSGFLFGLTTKVILQILQVKEIYIAELFLSAKTWFLSSIIACVLGILGSFLIFDIFSNLERNYRFILVLGWNLLTFALFPLVVADKRTNPLYVIPTAFKITFKTIPNWFYLYLIIIFISGEILQLFPTNSTEVFWSGGYNFPSVWNKLILEYFSINQSYAFFANAVFLLINMFIAILVKIRLSKILIKGKYISF